MPKKIQMLFLSSFNSSRSQMTEGFSIFYHKETIEAFSAGLEKGELDPLAIKVMAEIGIDISKHKSKNLSIFREKKFDYVVFIHAFEPTKYPLFPASTKILNVTFDDLKMISRNIVSDQEILNLYRRERDQIGAFIKKFGP